MRLVVILVVLLCGGCGTVSVAVNYNDGPTQAQIAYHANLSQVKFQNYAR